MAGHVCGAGATTPTERVCGGDGSTFCPEGSSAPTEVRKGGTMIGGTAATVSVGPRECGGR